MRILTFATQKGGCGKSTLAACLAVAAQAAGERVFILDMDPKKSLVRWGVKRQDRNLPVRAVSSTKFMGALESLANRRATLVLVDTPALERVSSLTPIKAANLSIVPARPSTFDIWASEVTGRQLRLMNKEFVFLLNQCPPPQQTARIGESIAALQAVGAVVHPHIRARKVFLDAAKTGRGVTEVDPKGDAASEMHELWLAIKRRLPLSHGLR